MTAAHIDRLISILDTAVNGGLMLAGMLVGLAALRFFLRD